MLPELKFVAPPSVIHPELAAELGVVTFGKLHQNLLWEQLELPVYLRRRGNPLLINLCNVAPVLYHRNVVSVLDLSFHLHPEWFSKQFSTLYNFVVPYTARRAKRVVTISTNSKNDIIQHLGIPESNIEIIYPSISSIFKQAPSHSSANPYGTYILSVSSLDPRKNFAGLIRAFLAADLPNTQLLIVGSANKVFADQGLKSLIGDNKRITFTGYVSDEELANLYRHAALFAYPSYFEGFGIPPLEAMAAGCPTLVSNTTSMPEVCGEASYYVDPYDIVSIKKGLTELIHNQELRNELVKKGYQQIAKYSWSESANVLSRIILDVLAEQSTDLMLG